MNRLVPIVALSALALTACGHGGGKAAAAGTSMPGMDMTAPPTTADQTPVAGTAVDVTNFAFQPAVLTVKVGQAVTWTNHDEEPHTVTGGGMKSPVLGNQGSTYSHAFTTPGTYSYNCSIHPFMHGTVVVTA